MNPAPTRRATLWRNSASQLVYAVWAILALAWALVFAILWWDQGSFQGFVAMIDWGRFVKGSLLFPVVPGLALLNLAWSQDRKREEKFIDLGYVLEA